MIFAISFESCCDKVAELSQDKAFLSDYEKVLDLLDDECKDLVVKHFKEGKALNEIASEEKVSYEVIEARLAKTLRLLRHPSRSKILSKYI